MTTSIKTALAGFVIGLVIGLIIGWLINGWRLESTIEGMKATAAADAVKAANEKIAKLEERLKDQDEAAQKTKDDLDTANAAATAARTAAAGLQGQLAGIKRRYADSATAGGCAAATQTSLLLADMFGECTERYRAMGEYADRAGIAGAGCEAQYDALEAK